jgi:hypothetical protein
MGRIFASLTATAAAALAAFFCAFAFRNPPARQRLNAKEFDLTILTLGCALLVVLVALVWIRPTRARYYSTLAVSAIFLCYAMLCLLS